jgi:hypothetical protein
LPEARQIVCPADAAETWLAKFAVVALRSQVAAAGVAVFAVTTARKSMNSRVIFIKVFLIKRLFMVSVKILFMTHRPHVVKTGFLYSTSFPT